MTGYPRPGEPGQRPAASRDHRPVYDTARLPPASWRQLAALWAYRDLVRQLVVRDVKVRYKRSVLGVGWTMLHPLLLMVVISLVFAHLFAVETPGYPAYFLAGTLVWNFFQQSTTTAIHQVLAAGPLSTRIYVPQSVFVVAGIGAGLVNLLLALLPLLLVMLVTGVSLQPSLLWLPLPLFVLTVFALGMALLVASLAVSFSDLVELYQVVLSIWYFLSPIIYPLGAMPEPLRPWLELNPMTHLLTIFRAPLLGGTPPPLPALLAAGGAAFALLVVGWWVFANRADELVYHL